MSDKVRPEAILIPEGALEELGVSTDQFADAVRQGGSIEFIPRRVALTYGECARLMCGETMERGGVEITMQAPYDPDEPPATFAEASESPPTAEGTDES